MDLESALIIDVTTLLSILLIILIFFWKDDGYMLDYNKHNIVELVMADEECNTNEFEEKTIYVTNLGITLSQAKDGVRSLRLLTEDKVQVVYKDGSTDYLLLRGKTYSDITKEIIKFVLYK